MLQAELLENITETKYLSEDKFMVYRTIMRLFYLENQKMHYQMDRDAILSLLRQQAVFADYTPEQLTLDLQQLVKWRNLTPIQDPRKPKTIAEFKNRQFQYMMTQTAIEVERLTITLENLSTRLTGLSASPFRRIRQDLLQVSRLDDMNSREINAWWQDLQEDFQRLSQNHQDYLRNFYGPSAEMRMQAVEFISYKQQLVRYLEEFIQDLQHSAAQIAAELEKIPPEQVDHMIDLVQKSELEVPHPQLEQNENWKEDLRTRCRGVWQSLSDWFLGSGAVARQVLDVTNEVIRRAVQNAALLVQMENMGVSNKAELQHLLHLFAGCENVEESHRLSALVFGAQQARHYTLDLPRESDRIDQSPYEEPAMEFRLQPRTRAYRPRIDRTGFRDKTAEKAAQRQKVLEEKLALQNEIMACVRDGMLDLSALDHPISPAVRNAILNWISLANLSPDRRGQTEYGQTYTVETRGEQPCRLQCTDGVLTMPAYVLVFEEAAHV